MKKAKSRLLAKSRIERNRDVKGKFTARISWGERLFIVNLLLGTLIWGYFNYSSRCVSSEPIIPTIEVKAVEPVKERDYGIDTWTGEASYYSRNGCLGCSTNLHMANGKPLDDTKLTIAFNKIPLGKKVRVINNDTYDSVVVEVTDTGGFERPGLDRIADLTIATRDAINCGNLCDVTILYDKDL